MRDYFVYIRDMLDSAEKGLSFVKGLISNCLVKTKRLNSL